MKKIVKIIGVVFILWFFLIILYSRTIYQQNLPLVKMAVPESGKFEKVIQSNSVVELGDNRSKIKGYNYMSNLVLTPEDMGSDTFFIYAGDAVEVEVPSERFGNTKGEVILVLPDGNNTKLTIGFNFEGLLGGEAVNINIRKVSSHLSFILPKNAVFTDAENGKDFIYLVKEKDGAWGKEYYLSLQNTEIIAEDANKVALSELIQIKYPVVISSDKELYDGCVVRFY
ncbi:MAG: hypothetical protein LBC56_00215 [Oscillospiraceae bacterium]|jgi:hypothetical protein|nr:hypothetical protein [Oscillospiraceae bacterium]